MRTRELRRRMQRQDLSGRLPPRFGAPVLGPSCSALFAGVQLEESHNLLQRLGLTAHLLCGRSQLLRRRRVLLRDLRELCHGGVDLTHARGLLLRSRRDLLHEIRCLLDRRHHLAEKLACFLRHRDRAAGHLADFLRRNLAPLGEFSHFARHHGEALAVLAGPRRLDRRVQRQ